MLRKWKLLVLALVLVMPITLIGRYHGGWYGYYGPGPYWGPYYGPYYGPAYYTDNPGVAIGGLFGGLIGGAIASSH